MTQQQIDDMKRGMQVLDGAYGHLVDQMSDGPDYTEQDFRLVNAADICWRKAEEIRKEFIQAIGKDLWADWDPNGIGLTSCVWR